MRACPSATGVMPTLRAGVMPKISALPALIRCLECVSASASAWQFKCRCFHRALRPWHPSRSLVLHTPVMPAERVWLGCDDMTTSARLRPPTGPVSFLVLRTTVRQLAAWPDHAPSGPNALRPMRNKTITASFSALSHSFGLPSTSIASYLIPLPTCHVPCAPHTARQPITRSSPPFPPHPAPPPHRALPLAPPPPPPRHPAPPRPPSAVSGAAP